METSVRGGVTSQRGGGNTSVCVWGGVTSHRVGATSQREGEGGGVTSVGGVASQGGTHPPRRGGGAKITKDFVKPKTIGTPTQFRAFSKGSEVKWQKGNATLVGFRFLAA